MKNRNVTDVLKNTVSTVFLLTGAFLVCSTLMSMRAVFADPIAPTYGANNGVPAPQTSRAGSASRASGRTSPRSNSANTVSRTTASGVSAVPSRAVASRNTVNRTTVNTSNGNTVAAPRTTATRTMSRDGATTAGSTSRGVVSRTPATRTTASRVTSANTSRSVRARNTANTARISLQGSAIRGSSGAATNKYTYLSNKLHTGNYSNIIDSTTGLISADAYNNCMESYYTCMDEICTARNAAQRRCACAGRVKAFADAESQLETANEELIKVSGELALLIANKGKDISAAFNLTDAEKVLNCVSWKEMNDKYSKDSSKEDKGKEWCQNHGIYDDTRCSYSQKPSYCTENGNTFGFNIDSIELSGSDILASLQAWADAKDNATSITSSDNNNLGQVINDLGGVVSGLAGIDGVFENNKEIKDSLAETWGYELFEYAHNNVCNRVLDSCFNGIYEACGTPPSSGRKCSNGAAQCPYNYNSIISVDNSGSYELNFVTGNSGYTSSNSATCFGYTSSAGDPYSDLRGPVADARRSIMQKYALDANADCDAYGEQLRTTAQNIGYQKVAAQQALQQKRLEFANEEKTTTLNDALAASTNFGECLSEILDCYETQSRSNTSWTTARIKTYCAQISNAPHCYEEMICSPSTSPFKAVINLADSEKCKNDVDYRKNTCRNVVTLNDILSGTGATATACPFSENATGECNSAGQREQCLLNSFVSEIRTWRLPVTCPSGTSTTGLGGAVSSLSDCKCQNIGEKWDDTKKQCEASN